MGIGAILSVALPCILIGGAFGALVGAALGSPVGGIRVGVILGGVGAFLILRRRVGKRTAG